VTEHILVLNWTGELKRLVPTDHLITYPFIHRVKVGARTVTRRHCAAGCPNLRSCNASRFIHRCESRVSHDKRQSIGSSSNYFSSWSSASAHANSLYITVAISSSKTSFVFGWS